MMNLDGDDSPIPANPFENKQKLDKLKGVNFNFKDNFLATTGVSFSEEVSLGHDKQGNHKFEM